MQALANYVRPETLRNFAAASLTVPFAVAAQLRGERGCCGRGLGGDDVDRREDDRFPISTGPTAHAMAEAFERHVPSQPILVHDVYWGAISYHFRRPLIYVREPEALPDLLRRPDVPAYAIVMNTTWEGTRELWAGFEKIDESWLEARKVALLRRSGEERPQ
jgi:hypothetical protein